MRAATDAAYQAVMRPVEGTILTVVREATEAAEALVADDADAGLVAVLEAARDARARRRSSETPDLLPVLAEAGVVDAGGAGFLLLLDAMLHVADGRPMPEPRVGEGAVRPDAHLVHAAIDDAHDSVSDLRYEVMYFLEADDEAIPAFKDVWAGIGDSIVVVGGDGIWNCHIHTDDIGAAIEAAVDCGRPRQIRVTDLMEQVEEERWVREAGVDDIVEVPPHVTEPVTTAVVAVAAGDGIKRIFYSLGVQGIVAGGQSMNPSTADLLAAVEAVPADQVVILPNNKNIIPVAEQVDAHTDRTVPRRGHPGHRRGLRRPHGLRPRGAGRRQRQGDDGAVGQRAGRRGHAGGARLDQRRRARSREGDYLGIARDGIKAVEPTVAEAATRLLDAAGHRRPRDRHRHRGRGRHRRPTPGRSPSGWASTVRACRPRSTTGGSRSTRTCSASSSPAARDPMTDGPITLGELATWPVTRLNGVGDRKAEGLATLGVTSMLDLLTYYPRRYVDRTNEARIRDLVVGEEAMVLVTVVRTSSRRTRGRPPKVLVTADVRDDSGTPAGHVLQPGVARAPARRGPDRGAVRQGRAVRRAQADDQPGRRPHRQPDGPHRAHLPAVREGPPVDLGDRRLGGRGPAPVGRRAAWPTPCPSGCSTGTTW